MSQNRSVSRSFSVSTVLAEWAGPYGGVPAFDTVKLEDLEPALETAMAHHLAELDALAANAEAPTFETTIVAMEDAGRDLDRVYVYFGIWNSNRSSEESRAIQRSMAPKLSEYRSKITQNRELFARVKAVYEGEEMGNLGAHEQRLTWLVYNSFAHNGAELEGDEAARYAEINARLAELHTSFSNNVLHDEESYVLYLDDSQLGGLSEAEGQVLVTWSLWARLALWTSRTIWRMKSKPVRSPPGGSNVA